MSPATDFIDPNLSGTASKAFHLFSTEPKKQFCIVFFFFCLGWRGWTVYRPNFLFIFLKFCLILGICIYLFYHLWQFLFITFCSECVTVFYFFVCLIDRRKVKLNKHTQSTFMHNHVYLWNIEGVLCVHVNVAQNQSSYG